MLVHVQWCAFEKRKLYFQLIFLDALWLTNISTIVSMKKQALQKKNGFLAYVVRSPHAQWFAVLMNQSVFIAYGVQYGMDVIQQRNFNWCQGRMTFIWWWWESFCCVFCVPKFSRAILPRSNVLIDHFLPLSIPLAHLLSHTVPVQ